MYEKNNEMEEPMRAHAISSIPTLFPSNQTNPLNPTKWRTAIFQTQLVIPERANVNYARYPNPK